MIQLWKMSILNSILFLESEEISFGLLHMFTYCATVVKQKIVKTSSHMSSHMSVECSIHRLNMYVDTF